MGVSTDRRDLAVLGAHSQSGVCWVDPPLSDDAFSLFGAAVSVLPKLFGIRAVEFCPKAVFRGAFFDSVAFGALFASYKGRNRLSADRQNQAAAIW